MSVIYGAGQHGPVASIKNTLKDLESSVCLNVLITESCPLTMPNTCVQPAQVIYHQLHESKECLHIFKN